MAAKICWEILIECSLTLHSKCFTLIVSNCCAKSCKLDMDGLRPLFV